MWILPVLFLILGARCRRFNGTIATAQSGMADRVCNASRFRVSVVPDLLLELDDQFHETDHIYCHHRILVSPYFATTSWRPNLVRHIIRTMEAPD